MSDVQVDSVSYASQLAYNAASQTTALNIGPANAYQTTETYDYDAQTGLLTGQKVYRGTDTPQNRLLHMSYNYLRAGTTDGRTGQLTGSTNNLDATQGKDRNYEYDALGRLKRATGGGATGGWAQRYLYDRFGNRANVLSQRTSEFITNVYHAVLNREPGSGERQPADNALRQAYAQGPAQFLDMAQTTVAGLFSTQEYTNRNRTDHEYVYDLYQAYLQREPDQGGWAGWTAAVASVGRAAVQQGFADSVEFSNRVSGLYPGAGATGSAPTGLTVTTNSSAQVSLNWTAAGGTVDHYEVERRGAGGGYAWLANTPTPAFNDTAVTGSGAAYLYQVRAVFAGGATSAYSNAALGTAVSFTDEPLVAGATPIKAQHLYELRQAVNAVRRLAGLGDATWTDVALVGVVVKATHVQELRDRLNEALVALGLPAGTWTDAALATGAQGTAIKAVHVTELRTRATRGSGTAQGGGGTPATVPVDGWNALSFDAQTNRINSAGWEYDAAGNQTRALSPAGSWLRYEYDAAGRLVRVKNDANQIISIYSYGDSNQRLITEESGQRTYYVWAGGAVIAEYAEDVTVNVPAWTKSYVYLGNRLLATLTPNGSTEAVQYHHPDRLGTRLITNGADAGYFEQTALPFGTALDAESTGATNRRFTSYDRSSVSKLDYAVNRTYDSMQGRFTQVDPIGMGAASLGNPQSFNLYAYCGNDPINNIDPSGLFWGKLFRGILKVLTNKWVQVAIAVALIVLSPPSAGIIFNLLNVGTKAASTLSSIFAGISWGLRGALAVGMAAQSFQDPQDPGMKDDRNFPPEDAIRIDVRGYPWPNVMQPAPSDNSSWWRLGWEFFSGRGPRERQLGPDSDMTKGLRTSPDVDYHRNEFCKNYPRKYGPKGAKFGLDALDGPFTAGRNMPRQFVGSFTITIENTATGNTLFVINNETTRRSFFYGYPLPNPKSGEPLSGTSQTYWWTEQNPCGGK